MTVLNKGDELSSLRPRSESSNILGVIIKLHVNKTCVNASDVSNNYMRFKQESPPA